MQYVERKWRRWSAFLFVALLLLSSLPLPMWAQESDTDSAHKVFLPLLANQGNAAAEVDASAAQPGAAIHLWATTFTPGQGQAPVLPPGLTVAGYQAGVRGYYLVQFAGPVQQAWKDAVAAAGAEVLDYIPDFAFKVRMNPAQAAQVANLANVAWVGLFQPAYKLSPDLVRDGVHLYRVRIEQGADAGLATAAIAQSGAEIVSRADGLLMVAADATQLQAIANVLDVAWIENFVMPEKHGDFGAGVILGSATVNANGYNGSSQIAAVADTGLGDGTATGAHPDIPASRIVAIYNWPGVTDSCFQSITNDGAQDVDSGHGTHVAVSVLGDGDGTTTRGIGTAPGARLVFQATENWVTTSNLCKLYGYPNDYYLTGLPADLRTLYQQAYNAGARIHANSWGSAQAGAYTANSVNTDDFIWTNRDMVITFSAGNEGIDANADGIIDNDSIGAPATAKNVLTIGASENQRTDNYPCDTSLTYPSRDAYQPGTTCSGMGGQNLLGTYGQRWGTDYPANPIAGDLTAGNMEQMAAFSSRGPTNDGRIKPDVVAPGTWILAGYSSKHQEGYSDPINTQSNRYQMDGWGMPYNANYKYFGGTSMSNPLAAGAATVVRDFYNKMAPSINASAALVKATLINSAVDMSDENNDGANDNDYPIPNSHEGWGRINLVNATDNSAYFVDQTSGLTTGGSAVYQFNLAGGAPFKATLVWSDYRSTEAATKNLVNDLDVVVTRPDGVQYRGNVFSGGWSATGGTADRTNNVENVYVQSATNGIWRVTISGFNVPNGPQPFALVVEGGSYITLPAMHVGDLDGAKSTASAGKWNATVTLTIHDASHVAVAGATVTGAWSGGATGSASCTTNSSGTCSVSKTNIAKTATSVTFTVSGVTHASYTYQASSNHDPETDSNGTAITITKP